MCAYQKLRLDFTRNEAPQSDMDEDTDDLIAKLCTRIRMIMEDARAVALIGTRGSVAEVASTVARIERASKHIGFIANAARTLLDAKLDGLLV